jgi:hypothetical protein
MKKKSGKAYVVTGRSKMGANVHSENTQEETEVGEFPTVEQAQAWVQASGQKDHIYFVWVKNPLEKIDKAFVEKWSWRNDARRAGMLPGGYFDQRWHRIVTLANARAGGTSGGYTPSPR